MQAGGENKNGQSAEDRDEEEARIARSHRGLMAVVIILGILLVVGFAVVVATIAARLSGGDEEKAAPAAPVLLENTGGEVVVPVPAGYRVQSVGGDERRLILHLVSEAGPERILIVDARDGRLISSLIVDHTAQTER